MLPGGNKEGSVNQGIPFKNRHHTVAEDTRNPVHFVCCIVREDEAASFIISNAAFIFHLDVIRVNLLPR